MNSQLAGFARYAFPGFTIVLWAVSLIHLVQGTMILIDPAAIGVTTVIHIINAGIPRVILGIWYLLGMGLAINGIVAPGRHGLGFHIGMWFPQQLLVLWGAMGSIQAMMLGAYLDGTVVPTTHIIADQVVYPMLAIAHLGAFILWQTLGREYENYRNSIAKRYETILMEGK